MWRQAGEALARAGDPSLEGKMLTAMSAGEKRRVLIARALVTNPRALLLDEPTTGLDLVARHAFMESVRRLAREGTTLILVTHHVDEIVPEIGRVVCDGPTETVLNDPRLGDAYGAPLAVERNGSYYRVRVR